MRDEGVEHLRRGLAGGDDVDGTGGSNLGEERLVFERACDETAGVYSLNGCVNNREKVAA
jgi:hypothetical protein